MAFQKKTFVWHIGWYSKNLIAYYTLEQNLFYYFFSDYNSFAEILLSFRCRFEGCIFFVNTRQPVLMKKMQEKRPHFCVAFSHISQQNRSKSRKRVKFSKNREHNSKITQRKMPKRLFGLFWKLEGLELFRTAKKEKDYQTPSVARRNPGRPQAAFFIPKAVPIGGYACIEPFPEKRTQKVKKKWNDSRGIRYRWLCSGAEKIILKTRGRNPTQSRVRAEGVVEDFQIGKDIALRRRSGWIVF